MSFSLRHPALRLPPALLVACAFSLAAATHAPAGLTVQHFYRLGENDPGAAASQAVTGSRDLTGSLHLTAVGTPTYSAEIPAPPANTSLAVQFDGASALATNAVLSAATDNFVLELWVKPSTASGDHCLAYNGNTGGSGWGIFQFGDRFAVLYGGLVIFGDVPVVPGTWIHLALVRDNGLATFYANGVANAGSSDEMPAPDGRFSIGVSPPVLTNEPFSGVIDEVRYSTIIPGQFSTDDLLYHAPRIRLVATASGNALPNGSAQNFGGIPALSTADLSYLIENQGINPLTIAGAVLSGPDASQFSISAAPGTEAPTGFTVRFQPTSQGPKAATLTLTSSDPVDGTYQLVLNGTGGPPPDLAVFNGASTSPADERSDNAGTFAFANTPRDQPSATQTFTLKNVGGGNLLNLAVSVSGAQASEFTVTQPGTAMLAPGATTTFNVVFRPTVFGTRTAVVAIVSNDPDENPFEINVSGACNFPEIVIEQPPGTALLTGTAIAWGSNLYGQTNVPAGLHALRNISGGGFQALGRRGDGTVVAWGLNIPGTVPTLTDLKTAAISAGYFHGLALLPDGTVRAWGSNEGGSGNVPAGLAGVTALSAGGFHNLVRKSDGTVVTFGLNTDGQCTAPAGLNAVQAVCAGLRHSLALKNDGTVVAWGKNDFGQGVVPAGLAGVTALAASSAHNLALKNDATVVAWGSNDFGKSTVPAGLTNVVGVAAGQDFSAALRDDGTVATWGLIAQTPPGLVGVRSISAGTSFVVALVNPNVAFGNQAVGTTSPTKSFTVRNSGTVALNLSSISLAGPHAGDFTLNTAGTLGSVPGSNGQTTFSVTFTPQAAGFRSARLVVLNDDSDEGIYEIALTGTGVVQSALQNWRQSYFGSPNNTGNGADGFDFDWDGLPNLVEYAFGLDPTNASSAQLPQPSLLNGLYGYRFSQPAGVSGVVYGAEWSTTLQAGDWHPLTDTGSGGQHIFTKAVAGNPKLFVRLVVTAP